MNKIAAVLRLIQANLFVNNLLLSKGAARLVAAVVVLAVVVSLYFVVNEITRHVDHV